MNYIQCQEFRKLLSRWKNSQSQTYNDVPLKYPFDEGIPLYRFHNVLQTLGQLDLTMSYRSICGNLNLFVLRVDVKEIQNIFYGGHVSFYYLKVYRGTTVLPIDRRGTGVDQTGAQLYERLSHCD